MTAAVADRPARRRQLRGLDLIRGVAALLVLIYHIDFMFGLRGALLSSGYLSVDLFFVLSGFVVAYAYEADIRDGRMSLRDMALRRFARLYPLYGLTFVLGLFVMTTRYWSLTGHLDAERVLLSALANLFVLPTCLPLYQDKALFPFNAASWSIFYEAVVNLTFFLYLARMSTRGLILAWIAAAFCLVVAAQAGGSLDVGWGLDNALAGFPRITASFLTGMLIWRRYRTMPWRVPSWVVCALVVALAGIAQVRFGPGVARASWDLAVVLVFLPCLVVAGVGTSFGPPGASIAGFFGRISYSVYMIQDLCILIAAGTVEFLLRHKIYDFAPGIGFLFVPAMVVLSYASYRYFERPARARFRTQTRAGPAVAVSL